MPASRWNTNIFKLIQKMDNPDSNPDENLINGNSFFGFDSNPQPADDLSIEPTVEEISSFPEEIAILPLRGLVAYPQTLIPLTIGLPRSIRLIDDAVAGNRLIGLLASQDPDIETPGPQNLYQIGTIAAINRLFRAPDGTIRILVQGIARFQVLEFTRNDPYLFASITPAPETQDAGLETEALLRNARDLFENIAAMVPSLPRELVSSVLALQDPLQIAYTIANFQRMELAIAQQILEIESVSDKLRRLVSLLLREKEVLELGQKIQNEARTEMEKMQREYFLREQMKAIQHELGEKDEQTADVEEFRKKIDESGMPEESEKQARRELDRLSRLPTAAAEYGVIRTYLDWLTGLPWQKNTPDNLDIQHARQILDQDHYGLQDVKERILEFLAVRQLRLQRKEERTTEIFQDQIRHEREGVILCFVGPPGVGKTSLGQSIARALGRKFIRASLGGTRDEAEIRGHRRTYIGAMPGRVLQSIRRAETRNPVFMLDEIDKLGVDFHGDPASALLEVLDPEQNTEFRDNYLEVPFDLSQVMFITTANQLETIPAPLLDRMEIIQIAGYTESEKIQIATSYLVPRQVRENGLHPGEIHFTPTALQHIIRLYTREAGVRNLEREIGSICRKIATRLTESKAFPNPVDAEACRELLGRPRFLEKEEISRRTQTPGVATGLAWTPYGGEVLFIEVSRMRGQRQFTITGSVGKVMQESAYAAMSYVRSHANELHVEPDFFENFDWHLHIPASAQPKDGPSAGVTIATALVSLLTGQTVRADLGMTGEITLLGKVLPVGGIKEKVLAAHRAGLKTIILPAPNAPDLDDLPEEIRKELTFIFADTLEDVLQNAFESLPAPISKRSQKKQETKS